MTEERTFGTAFLHAFIGRVPARRSTTTSRSWWSDFLAAFVGETPQARDDRQVSREPVREAPASEGVASDTVADYGRGAARSLPRQGHRDELERVSPREFSVPGPREMVNRPRVRLALDNPAGVTGSCPVLLVSAPAGFGKTVAVADWVRSTPGVPTAWLSLDGSDRDDARWWRSVLGALSACPQVPPDSRLHHLQPTSAEGHGPEGDAFLAAVLDALDDLPDPVRLVLDDVQEIVGHPAERALRALVRHPIRGLTLVLCSRFDPPIGLDRLRLEGRLGEVRVDRLAFTAEETASLFEQTSVDLTAEEISTLVDRTDGWAAALRLVARSLQTSPDPPAAVRDSAGDDRSVADYVVDEVLSKLADPELRIVEAACACSPISVDLAIALTGDEDAAEVLERLEATTGMVTAVDRRREQFHTHELLRSHVVARLRRTRWQDLRVLYQRAAAWYEGRDDAAALRYSALAGDVTETEALLRAHAIELLVLDAFDALAEPSRR